MKSPFVTSNLARTPFETDRTDRRVVHTPSTRARASSTQALAWQGLSIFLSALAVAVVTFFGAMIIFMAFD
jgi:hypothetical protein